MLMTKILFTQKLLLLICFIMIVGLVSSCKKDPTANSGKVELLSFGPSGAKHGENIIFIGKNLDKVTEIDLIGSVVPAASFIERTAEKIVFIIPMSAEQGFATLKTPDGDVVSKTKVNFDVPVKITSIIEKAKPGENITIKGEYMNWVKEIVFAKDVSETTFVSRSLTELVIKVPMNAQSGKLFINTGGTKPVTIETDSALEITLPSLNSFSSNPIERETNLTITGTDLDIVKGVLFKGIAEPVTSFVSQSATELVIKIPAAANKGKIKLVAHSGLTIESAASLLFIGDLPDLDPLSYAFYEDDLENNWQDWGWGRTADYKNTDNVRDGNASLKLEYTGDWSGLNLANSSVSAATYTEFTFSIFGTAGTGGKKINIEPGGATPYIITIDEGKWVEYKLTKAQLGIANDATIIQILFKNEDWKGLVYLDHIGFR
jgi:hypothetical protein